MNLMEVTPWGGSSSRRVGEFMVWWTRDRSSRNNNSDGGLGMEDKEGF